MYTFFVYNIHGYIHGHRLHLHREVEMKESQTQKAYDTLQEMIFTFRLAPGSRVSDFVLCKTLGMSRTPIRQAMLALASDGLLETDGVHFNVPQLTEKHIDDVYDARICLQTGLLRLAMEKGIPKGDLAQLRTEMEIVSNSENQGDIRTALNHDHGFNYLLASLGGNPMLLSSFSKLQKQIRVISILGMAKPLLKARECFAGICDAIEENDTEKACRLMTDYINTARDHKKNVIMGLSSEGLEGMYNVIASITPQNKDL